MVTRACCALAFCLVVAGCPTHGQPAAPRFEVSGQLEDGRILEASGLARSQRQAGVLWIINDNGAKEYIHAIDFSGKRLGELDLKKSKNRDWEDLASFRRNDKPYLMVADIGDNDAKRDKRTLYFLEEPPAEKNGKARTQWRVDYRYPNGPRDAEAAAIDLDNGRVLVLSKRDLPPQLYAIPLDTEDTVTAAWLGPLESLPKPTRQDIALAPKIKDWHWQPVGMDISDDRLAAVILTYRAAYYYRRTPGQKWYDALNGKPLRIGLGNFENAEAVAFGDDARTVFVTGENKHSRILRVDPEGMTAR